MPIAHKCKRTIQPKEIEPRLVGEVHLSLSGRAPTVCSTHLISLHGVHKEDIIPEALAVTYSIICIAATSTWTLLQIDIGVIGAFTIEVIVRPRRIILLIDIALSEIAQHLRGLLVELTVQRIGLTILRREIGTTDRSNAIVRTRRRLTTYLDILPIDVQDRGRGSRGVCLESGTIHSLQHIRR